MAQAFGQRSLDGPCSGCIAAPRQVSGELASNEVRYSMVPPTRCCQFIVYRTRKDVASTRRNLVAQGLVHARYHTMQGDAELSRPRRATYLTQCVMQVLLGFLGQGSSAAQSKAQLEVTPM